MEIMQSFLRLYENHGGSLADDWHILLEPGNKVKTFFLVDYCSKDLAI